MVREPLRSRLSLGTRRPAAEVMAVLRRAALGPCDRAWTPPAWLLTHQVEAARRVAGSLTLFRGAILADSVGLGKTYVALAVATRYTSVGAVVPASLVSQWRRVAQALAVPLTVMSHEALSRGSRVPQVALLLVDEAHRFRNPDTRRHRALAWGVGRGHLLLLSATPMVNRVADLVHLVRLFLPDHALAMLGVPSLAGSLGRRALDPLAHALTAIVVARSPDVVTDRRFTLPPVRDAQLVAESPLPASVLRDVNEAIGALTFPTFADARAAELLRLHLFHRLSSSAPACVQTLRRHTAYLDRAIAAARRGERLSRSAARVIFGADDDAQLELDHLQSARSRPLDAAELTAERNRVDGLLRMLRGAAGHDPKAVALSTLLAQRAESKTIVFTSAVETARYLAGRSRWNRTAMATGEGARIAAGRTTLGEVLDCFAPRARRVARPPASMEVDVLIATDLISEGLDLQDANTVVHYDLPWTPLRLEQRLGRALRLGSPHPLINVRWFAPCPALEARMAFGRRIVRKGQTQLRLGVATTSRVGRARVIGGLFDWRDRLGTSSGGDGTGFAVVRGPAAAAFAVRWSIGDRSFDELIVVAGPVPREVSSERVAARLVALLMKGADSDQSAPTAPTDVLHVLLRRRLADAIRGPTDDQTRHRARDVLRLAKAAAKQRDHHLLSLLDAALDRLTNGVTAGRTRDLEDALRGPSLDATVRAWLAVTDPWPGETPVVTLLAALIGDGTLTREGG